jgi:hypothetical protein
MTGPARFYHDDRAGILGYYITAAKAGQVFAAQDCDGDLERGFSYWVSGAGVAKLVHIAVTPVAEDQVPPSVRAALEGGEDQVCCSCGSVERYRLGRDGSGG